MLKILTIIGARPQIIKAAAISRTVKNNFSKKISEIIVHTGQHYDENMSKVFFDEMGIPKPNYNLNVGSGSHAKQTAAMLTGIEEIILKEKPDCMVLYGDTNSTLAGSLAASKLHLPIVHIEAGLRSFNKSMPEEINRIVCDHASTLLFTPTKTGLQNLIKEGFASPPTPLQLERGEGERSTVDHPKIYHCGDVMYDNSLHFSSVAEKKTTIIKDLKLEKNNFILLTVHRDNNTDDAKRLSAIFNAVDKISREEKIKIVLPLHPRTSKLLEKNLEKTVYQSLKENSLVNIIPPVSFLEMITLEKNSKLTMTDSGGVQKESFFFQKPCIILRSETEWTELAENGNAIVADANEEKILKAYHHFKNKKDLTYPSFYGDGKAAEFICEEILKTFGHELH